MVNKSFFCIAIGIASLVLFGLTAYGQELKPKIRIANSAVSVTALPLVAAREWGFFRGQGLEAEIIMIAPSVSAPALIGGEIDYVAGVGPGSVSATLGGLPMRAVWFSSNRISYWLMTSPQYKTLQDLKGKKVGVTGSLWATNHVALVIALEKLGINPKDYIMLALPASEMQRSLESGFLDAASMNPPVVFAVQRKGFHRVLDVSSLVEMPAGGLTALTKDIKGKPEEVKRVIRALQMAKEAIRKSKERSVDLMMRTLKMERESAASTYDVFLTSLSVDGVPSRAGMEILIRSIQAQGRFGDKKPAFSDVADDRLAIEVARELGYKAQ